MSILLAFIWLNDGFKCGDVKPSPRSEAQVHVCLPVQGTPCQINVPCRLWYCGLCVYSKLGHHPRPLGYLCAKSNFFCSLYCCASPWTKIAYSVTQSLIQLIWCPGIEACASENAHILCCISKIFCGYSGYVLWSVIDLEQRSIAVQCGCNETNTRMTCARCFQQQ